MYYLRYVILILLLILAGVMTVPRRIFEMEQANLHDRRNNLSLEEYTENYKFDRARPLSEEQFDALEKLGFICWQTDRLPKAAELFYRIVQARQNIGSKKSIYDPKLVEAKLLLAGVYRDWSKYDFAEFYYKDIWNYDLKMLGDRNISFARDFQNLGLIYYLKAESTDDKALKATLFQRSISMLETARLIYQLYKGTERRQGNVLSTEYLVFRDMGEPEKAKDAKAKANQILTAAHPVCVAPDY